MAQKSKIELILSAKNQLAKGLAAGGRSLAAFGNRVRDVGRSLMRLGRTALKVFLGMSAAVVGFATKAVIEFSKKETAMRDMIETSRLYGDSVDGLEKKIWKIARAMQDETAVADDVTVSRMARLRALGIEQDMLEDAAKGVIALAKAGMGEEMAIRALAMAHKGDFQQLQRYIPTLRMATTTAEKAAAVNDFLTKGYARAAAELNTVSGQWRNFKGRVGDAMAEIGRGINRSEGLMRVLRAMSEAVKHLGNRISQYIDGEAFERLQTAAKGLLKSLTTDKETAVKTVVAIGDVIKTAFISGAWQAAEIIVKGIKEGLKASAGFVGKNIQRFGQIAQGPAGWMAGGLASGARKLTGGVAAGMTPSQIAEKDALEARKKLRDMLMAVGQQQDENTGKTEAETRALEKQNRTAREGLKARADLTERIRHKEELARNTVVQYIQSLRDARKESAQWEAQKKKAEELRAKQSGGGQLTQGERDLVEAVDKIGGAREAMAHREGLQAEMARVGEQQLATLDLQGKTLLDILHALQQLPNGIASTLEAKE